MIPAEWLALAGCDVRRWPSVHQQYSADEVPDKLWRTLVADCGTHGEKPPHCYRSSLACAINRRNTNGDIHTAELIRQGQPTRMVEFLKRSQDVTWNRKLFLSKGANAKHPQPIFGLGPTNAAENDVACVFYGCSAPIILRDNQGPDPDDEDTRATWRYIGESYIYGLMEGQALE